MPSNISRLTLEGSVSSISSPVLDVSGKRKLSTLGSEYLEESYGFAPNPSDVEHVRGVAGLVDDRPPTKDNVSAKIAVAVQVPGLSFPRSLYDDDFLSIPIIDEIDVLNEILRDGDGQGGVNYRSESNTSFAIDLEEFSIYRRHRLSTNEIQKRSRESPLANELVSLHEINGRSTGYFLFDGLICFGNRRWCVRRVPFDLLSIGRYEALEYTTVGSDIWIQSSNSTKREVWYRLGKPNPEYKRYQEPFLWIADLAKHVVDYLHLHTTVCLDDFRIRFHGWLKVAYRQDENLSRWLQEHARTDYRSAVVAHANFFYCQAAQVDTKHTKHPLWSEIDTRALNAIPEQIEGAVDLEMTVRVETGKQSNIQRKTTVTPYVHRCFAQMPWTRFLHSSISQTFKISPVEAIIEHPSRRNRYEGRTATNGQNDRTGLKREPLPQPIQVGDVVAVESDEKGVWKTKDTEYYAYVQTVTVTTAGRSLGLLWFYRPGDTACKEMHYPFEKELFLSDHCNCGDRAIYERDVIYLPQVAFFGFSDSPNRGFFCRQQYLEVENAWRTLQRNHFHCQCKINPTQDDFHIGDTVLIEKKSGKDHYILEPAILINHIPEPSANQTMVRRLHRKGRDYHCPEATPNELVYTNQFDIVPTSDIKRHCQVRFFTKQQMEKGQIPHPYSRRGQGDFFFITTQDPSEIQIFSRELELLPLCQPWPALLKPGWLPERDEKAFRRLRGLDIFCGGGNFGRGLEEGGAVHFEWAVDYFSEAIHTYKANLIEGKNTKLFRGSVNHYLSQAMAGEGIGLVAQKGQVDFISAGHSCQGFSRANPLRGIHDRGLHNESLVASAVSFIDYYRPKYALLENVLGIATGDGSYNVLSQVLCALVGMGYQVKTFILDAWNFSSPQSRSRVIISCAAAGLEPLEEPRHTHSHPKYVVGSSLGKTANGLRISARHGSPTPFEYVTAEEALKDLPAIDGRTSCIAFPDHRMSRALSVLDRIGLESVPRHPAAMSFVKAVERGYMPQPQIDNFGWHSSIRARKESRCWQRIRQNALLPTVTTVPRPCDGAAGNCVHWDQHRLLTVMEVRRAQGIPDDEVIIGEKSAQYKIVGNSVARPVAFALGLSLRRAWEASAKKAVTKFLDSHEKEGTQSRSDVEANESSDEGSDVFVERQSIEVKIPFGKRRKGGPVADGLLISHDGNQQFKMLSKRRQIIQEDTEVSRTNSLNLEQTFVSRTSPPITTTIKPKFEQERKSQENNAKIVTHLQVDVDDSVEDWSEEQI